MSPSDAPERISIVDVDMAKPIIADRRSGGHSRRSSTASWSSGQDLRVPDRDADDEDAGDPRKPPPKKSGKSTSRPMKTYGGARDMGMHEAIAKGLTTVPRGSGSRQTPLPSLFPGHSGGLYNTGVSTQIPRSDFTPFTNNNTPAYPFTFSNAHHLQKTTDPAFFDDFIPDPALSLDSILAQPQSAKSLLEMYTQHHIQRRLGLKAPGRMSFVLGLG
ncbi:hypothetical protein B0H14DRAFT_3696381 [Mycena olivaceomarginata]|nr:hypothetical protein B0H14DRAFT_3696381 [Mycena olivaceomarginata]